MNEVREIERKYDVDGPFEPPAELPGVTAVEGPEHETLDAAYYDTADLRLLRGRITLRRRSGGSDAGWHLKLPAGHEERIEVRLPLGSGEAARTGGSAAVPKELVALTLSRSRGAPLAQVARLRTERSRWRLLDGDTAVAEVVFDAVHAEVSGEDGSEPSEWNEVEVELHEGRRELLDELEPALRDRGARPASSASKVGRALAGVLATVRQPAEPDVAANSAGAAVLAYLREHVEALLASDPAVRRDEADSVHRMRVAARRVRNTLQSYRRILDRERTRSAVAELRWLGRVLSGARETQVQRSRLLKELGALRPELVVGTVVNRVDSYLLRRHTQAREALLRKLRGRRYLALLDELQRLLDDPPLTDEARQPATKVLPGLTGRAQRRARRAFDRYRQDPDHGDAALHEMRKATKRARYAVEAAAPALRKPARRSIKRLKAVQGLLGDHQDTVVSRDLTRRLGLQSHAEGENAFSYGVLLGRDTANAEHLRGALPALWKRADRRKTRRWMSK